MSSSGGQRDKGTAPLGGPRRTGGAPLHGLPGEVGNPHSTNRRDPPVDYAHLLATGATAPHGRGQGPKAGAPCAYTVPGRAATGRIVQHL